MGCYGVDTSHRHKNTAVFAPFQWRLILRFGCPTFAVTDVVLFSCRRFLSGKARANSAFAGLYQTQFINMTREEHLKFCSICFKRKLNPQVGLVCELTDKKADFEDECEFFELDEKEQQIRYLRKLDAAGDGETGDPKDYRTNKDIGAAIFIIGLAVTVFSFVASASTGFTVIASGAVVGGALQYFRGKEQERIFKEHQANRKSPEKPDDH